MEAAAMEAAMEAAAAMETAAAMEAAPWRPTRVTVPQTAPSAVQRGGVALRRAQAQPPRRTQEVARTAVRTEPQRARRKCSVRQRRRRRAERRPSSRMAAAAKAARPGSPHEHVARRAFARQYAPRHGWVQQRCRRCSSSLEEGPRRTPCIDGTVHLWQAVPSRSRPA